MKLSIISFLLLTYLQIFAQQSTLIVFLDSIIQVEADRQNFSGSVIVIENNQVIFTKSVGFADYESQVKNELDTKSNLASVGKLFTKIIILQLADEGKLKLTDHVSKFFPCFDSSLSSRITIADLLNHQAGLRDVYINKEYIKLVKANDLDFQNKVVRIISREKIKFIPGTKTDYSNSGYYLLGAIAAKVEGQSFDEIVTKRLFEPLGMTNSGFARTGDTIAGHAIPYKMKKGVPKEVPVGLIGDRPSGAGGEYSTALDLTKVYLSIMSDKLLLDDSSKVLLFNHSESFSWNEIKKSGKLIGYVGGDTRGWSSKITFYLLKNKNYGVVICANFDNMAHELDLKLRKHIMESGNK